MQRTMLLVLLMLCLFAAIAPAGAQDASNLLKDGSFEGSYSGRGRADFNIPADWNVWFAESPRTESWMNLQPVAFPHLGPEPDPKEGRRALNFNKNYATFTVAVYQQVSVTQGQNVQGSAFGYLRTCNIPEGADKCGSAVESGALIKVGIDPNGGTNPLDSDIVWSADIRPHDRWEQASVSATPTAGTVTFFIYFTESSPASLNNAYFDDARLTGGGGGGAAPGAAPAATPIPTAPPSVAFVVPQGAQDDGSIVHTVRAGDTIDSIAVAYGVTRSDILALNNISDPRIISIGQELKIRDGEGEGDDEEGDAENTEDSGDAPAEGEGDSTVEGDEPPADEGDAPDGEGDAPADEGDEPPADDEGGDDEEQPAPADTAPPAPVVANALPARDPSAMTASVCVMMFEDANQNRIQEDGEGLLAGGTIAVRVDGAETGEYQTDGVSEPYCLTELSAGEYVTVASAPTGYGLTTPNQLRVQANPGATINLAFGAAEGVVPAMVPPPDDLVVVDAVVEEQAAPRRNAITDNLGLIVFGLAGVVLVLGTGATLLLRRR